MPGREFPLPRRKQSSVTCRGMSHKCLPGAAMGFPDKIRPDIKASRTAFRFQQAPSISQDDVCDSIPIPSRGLATGCRRAWNASLQRSSLPTLPDMPG